MAPIHSACEKGDVEEVKRLIRNGADIHAETFFWGSKPLHGAARYGRTETVNLLLKNGADVNAKSNSGYTPLHEAAEYGRTEIVKLLIGKGADIHAKNNDGYGGTPLHYSAEYGHTETVNLLIDYGADVNAKNRFDSTPLHQAALWGKTKTGKLLLKNGADINVKNGSGKTPLDLSDNDEIAQMIKDEKLRRSNSFYTELKRLEDSETPHDAKAQLEQLKDKVSDVQQLKFFYTCSSAASKTKECAEENSTLISNRVKCTLMKETLKSVVDKFYFGGNETKQYASFRIILDKALKDGILNQNEYYEILRKAERKDTRYAPEFTSMSKEIIENRRQIDGLKEYVRQLDNNIGTVSDNLRNYQEAVQRGNARQRKFKMFSSIVSIATLGVASGVGELGTAAAGFILEQAVDYSDVGEIGEIIVKNSVKLEEEFGMDQETQTSIKEYLKAVINNENTTEEIEKIMEDEIEDRYAGQPERKELMRQKKQQKASILGMIKTAKIVSEQQSNTSGNIDMLKRLLELEAKTNANRKSIDRLKKKNRF